jgi:hypothetical protein
MMAVRGQVEARRLVTDSARSSLDGTICWPLFTPTIHNLVRVAKLPTSRQTLAEVSACPEGGDGGRQQFSRAESEAFRAQLCAAETPFRGSGSGALSNRNGALN